MVTQKSIAQLNDTARRHWYVPGLVTTLLTQGVQTLAPCCDSRRELLERIAAFTDFGPDNDPCGERDFGSLTYKGEQGILDVRLLRPGLAPWVGGSWRRYPDQAGDDGDVGERVLISL